MCFWFFLCSVLRSWNLFASRCSLWWALFIKTWLGGDAGEATRWATSNAAISINQNWFLRRTLRYKNKYTIILYIYMPFNVGGTGMNHWLLLSSFWFYSWFRLGCRCFISVHSPGAREVRLRVGRHKHLGARHAHPGRCDVVLLDVLIGLRNGPP